MVGAFGEVYLVDWGVASLIPTAPRDERDLASRPSASRSRACAARRRTWRPSRPRGRCPRSASAPTCSGSARLLYFILTGRPPFEGSTVSESLTRARNGLFADPERRRARHRRRPRCAASCARRCRRAPDDRHPSALALQEDVRGFLNVGLHFPSRVFPPGAVIVREGEPGDEAFIITAGNCMVVEAGAGRATAGPASGTGRRVRRDRDPVAHGAQRDGDRDRRGDGQDRDAAADRGAAGAQHLAGAVRARARRSLSRGRRASWPRSE